MTEELNVPLSTADLSIGSEVNGKVTYLAVYGAMVDIGLERNALLHISQVGRTDFRNIEDVFKIGEEVKAYVLKIDNDKRIALTMEKPPELPWSNIKKGEVYKGVVTRIESYGAFIDIGAERPGMVHVSELTDGYVQSPDDVVKVGEEVEVRVIKLNKRSRQIDLSMRTPAEEIQEVLEPAESIPTFMELAFRRAQEASKDRSDSKKKSKTPVVLQDDIIKRTLRNHNN